MYTQSDNRNTPYRRGYQQRSWGASAGSSSYRPQRSGGFSRGGGSGFGRRQKSLPNDPALFVKRATESTMEENYVAKNAFTDFNLSPILLSNITHKGYTSPTPIQDQAISHILSGRDLIGLASTGTGKTAAFLIPLIQQMIEDPRRKVLIVAPTRELALQVRDEFRDFTYNTRLYSCLLIGGSNTYRQIQDLRRNPNMVIATPGRLKDLIERKNIFLQDYSTIVLDEADLMVDIGFINDIKYFISLLPANRQSLFFSATIAPKVQGILAAFVKDPVTVSVKTQDTSENVEQNVIRVTHTSTKVDTLHQLLIKQEFSKVLVFGRTKYGIEKLFRELEVRGFRVGAIHGNKKQSQRQRVLQNFKANRIQVLLATDVASRGLDIPNVTHVINYELPETWEDYIHRIGRTGRAGQRGIALTFIQ